MFEINFEVTKNDDGKINGCYLSSRGDTESNSFVKSFPFALFKAGTANICFNGNKIIFEHFKNEFPGSFEYELDKEEIEALKKLIKPEVTISLEQSMAWGGSFKLFVKDENMPF